MYFKILKKDIRRKKSINCILLIFIMLATMFIAGSINNLTVVLGGMDYFMTCAEMPDYIIVSAIGGNKDEPTENDRNAEKFLRENENVTDYGVDDLLYAADDQFFKGDHEKLVLNGSILFNSCNIEQQKFFDENNKVITDMKDGTIYLKRGAVLGNDLKKGDTITIRADSGYERQFEVAGYCKDAFLGSDMMGMVRFVVSENDFEEMLAKSGLPYGKMYSVRCNDLDAFEQDYNNSDVKVVFSGDQKLIQYTYIMDMVIIGVLLMVSLCLIVIALVMLRFTIIFTVNEDFKEIGIMKAIGMQEKSIRKIYLVKYLVIALCGALLGFAASIPFSKLLLSSTTEGMVLEDTGSRIVLPLLLSILVCVVVVLFAYLATGKIRRFSPLDAIRNGNSGERFKKKGTFQLVKTHMRATSFLALNDVCSELKKYLVLLFAGMIGVWLVVMPTNTINTLRSKNIAAWFSMPECDYYINSDRVLTELISQGNKQAYYDYMNETKKLLQENGINVERITTEVMFRLKIRKGDRSYQSTAFQGLETDMDEYFYDEGTPPRYDNEIAITHMVAEKIDAQIGDTVYIMCGDKEKPFVITALYQSMNNMGEGIRIPEETELDYITVAGGFGFQITLQGDADQEEISEAMKKTSDIMPGWKVETMEEFIDRMIGGISDMLSSLKVMILALVIIINILIVVLMQKMFLIRERGEMGMMKALGFSNRDIIKWQTKRISMVLLVGIILGVITGNPFSQITAGQVFKIMGASKIQFEIRPLEVYLIYPVALFAATVLGCVLTMLSVRKISVQEVNNME